MALLTIRIERTLVADRAPKRRRWALVAAVLLAVASVTGVAGASPTTSTSDVAFATLTVPHKVLTNNSIGANKTASVAVIGGYSTVPTNATSVQLSIAAKGNNGGTLNFYPAGSPSGGSGQSLAYPSGGATVTTTIHENVGQSDQLTFANTGTGSVVVTATLIGYSTQVTAGAINGVGGSAGQVLTNNGSGGTAWATPSPGGAAYQSQGHNSSPLPNFLVGIDSLSLPAGSYLVQAQVGGSSFGAGGVVECLFSGTWATGPVYVGTTDIALNTFSPNRYYGSGSLATLVTLSQAGSVALSCDGLDLADNDASVGDTMIAVRVGSASGSTVPGS